CSQGHASKFVPAPRSSAPISEARRRIVAELPILEAHELHTFYGFSHILHGVSLTVLPGEAIGLMGRNGMGKTTLIRTLVGYLRPPRGRVLVPGNEMTLAGPLLTARRRIAYVPGGRGISPNLAVRKNLLMAARRGMEGNRQWTYQRVLATFPRLA